MAPTDTKMRSQQIPRRPSSHNHLRHHHHNHNESPYQPSPLIQQHQPFPSSTSSFSIRNSTLSSSTSLLGPNDSGTTPRSGSQASTSHFASNNNISNANSHYNFIQPTSYERPVTRSYSFGEGSLPRPSTGSVRNGSARTGTGILGNGSNNGLMRPRAATMHEALLQQRDSNSDLNSLYTIDHAHTPTMHHAVESEDDDMSYFGSAGQDYLLKKRRARMARRICAADLVALVAFTALVGMVEVEGGSWRWEWSLVPWPLAGMAVVRVAALAFTARYSHGNYNVGVIFVCGLITLYTLFEVNTVILGHIQVATVVIVQYIFTILMTQLHWISYSAHTPMSATLAYAYDPIMSDSITFSRESRYMGTFSGGGSAGQNGRQPPLRRGTSYGTMNGSPFDAVEEMDEGEDDDDDSAFIKVNVDLAASRKKHFGQYRRRVSSGSQSSLSDGPDDSRDANDKNNKKGQENEDEEEDQDMAVLLAFQDARRQQVYVFSPTASSSVLPAQSILSSQAGGVVAGLSLSPSSSSSAPLNKTPLSWAFRPHDSYSSSYDMRIAAAGGGGGGGGSCGVGGLTVGYTPRKRATRRSNFDPNGTGRRTWTGGHSIIYSGILLESSDDEAGVDGGLEDEEGQEGDAEDGDVAIRDSFAEEEEEGGDEFKINYDDHGDEEQTVEYTETTETTETTQTTETTTTTQETTVASHEATVVEGESSIDSDPVHRTGENDRVLVDLEDHENATDPTLKVEIDDTILDHGHGDQLAAQELVLQITDESQSRTTPTHAINTVQETTPSSEQEPRRDGISPTGNKNLDGILTFQDDQVHGHDGSDHLSNGRGRGVSTIKVKKTSNKQITAVLCEDPNCKEHPNQGGPPPDVDLGPDFPQDLDRTKIVDLDIKESSTESVERIGPNAGGDYDSDNGEVVPSGRAIRRPELGAIEMDGSLDLDKIIGRHPHDGEHGPREVHVRQRIEKTTIVESEDAPSGTGSDGLVVAVDPNALTKLVPVPLSPPNEPGDQDHIHMEGGRRVHIRQRTERIMIEEQNELGGPAIVGGAIVGGTIVGGAIVGGAIVDNQPGLIVGPTVSTTISPEPTMTGGWVGIQEQPGVVTWGYATDVDQPTMIVEPTVYIPPERPVIVGQGPAIQTVEPVMVIEEPRPVAIPPRVVVPPPQPMIAPPPPRIMAPPPRMIQPAPQPMIQPQPAPVFQPPPRPMIRPPVRMMPQPQPQIMAPAPVIRQPVPRAIVPAPAPIIPAPMPVVQPAPQYVAPIPAPAVAMPQPMVAAPSEYAYYDDVGPAGVGGYGAYSVASIYENDVGNQSIVSIYDDRSVASVYEYENQPGAGYRPGYGPGYGAGGLGAGYGPGYGPGYGRHMASAAHIGRTDSPGPLHRERREDGEMYIENRHMPRQKSPPQGNYIDDMDTIPRQQSPSQRVLDQQRFYHESAAYNENRHEPARQLSPRYLEQAERFERGADVYLDNRPAQGQMSPRRADRPERQTYFQSEQHQRPRNPQGGAEETLEYIASRHVSRSAATQNREPEEESYQEMELGGGIGQVQELALETYYDTTKSQLKVREQQGNALAEKVFQLQHRSNEPATPPLVTENIALEPPTRPLPIQPPTFSIPKPPANPPPVRLLVNRGVGCSSKPSSPPVQAHHMSSFPKRYSPNSIKQKRGSEEEENNTPILSTSSTKNETIMLQSRQQAKTEPAVPLLPSTIAVDNSALAAKARPLISGTIATSPEAASSVESSARHPPVTVGAKKRRKEHFPAMSRNHLHPSILIEGIWACWNNEFGMALEIFKEHAATYPRWCLATAEVHIVRQLISGQLSEPDLDLTDSLQLSEKVGSRVLEKKQEFDASYMGYRSLCAADASLMTVNDNTLRQNYKWDCEMAFYDTLLYRGILQLTSASDTKGTFTDIKGGLQLRRAWKGYMRIKQEMELAKEKWQRLSTLNTAASSSTPSQSDDKENTPPQGAKPLLRSKTALAAVASPISIPTSKRASMQASSQPSEGSRWSIFGRRASLSSSPPVEGSDPLTEPGVSRSRFLAGHLGGGGGPAKGLASALRDQAKAVEEFKHAVKVLEDTEDYLQYGIGLFYFIVSIVPKSLVPALRTIGLQSNHEQGIKNFEDVLSRKNGRGPFAALFLLINYLFLPRGVADPSISLGRAGVILNEALRRCPNGSSYLLMACHHARKTGNMIPSAMNHITRGIQTCEAAGIPSINYRFELGLTFFIHQEFGKAADIFEILWRKYINQDIEMVRGHGGRRKGRSQSLGQPGQTSALPIAGAVEEDEEDDFELAPFCGLCLIASKVVVRLGQEGYFEYGREGFGRNAAGGANSAGGTPSSMEGVSSSSNFARVGPDFDLLMAAQEVLSMMSPPSVETVSSPSPPQPLARASTLIFEHVKAGSSHSIKYVRDLAQGASTDSSGGRDPLLAPAPIPAQGKLNRFNKFAWNQCQKSIQKGRISPFLPLVILYLRRDLAYMKPVLLRKYRTLLESIWKTVPQPVDADTQAIYLLLSAVVHRQLLPDDSTFSYTALTDCLLLESMIESEMWVVPYCHYELGELLFKKLQLPQAAIEQFQWIIKGPGKEVRPSSVYVSTLSASTSNPRLSVYGGGFPSDTVTQLVESASHIQETGNGDSQHSQHLSGSSQYRLSQFFPGAPTSQAPVPTSPNPPNPMSFYNSRYKKFEFSQALRHRSSICVEQIQKAIEEANEGGGGGGTASTSSSRAGTVKGDSGMDLTSTSRRRGSSLLAKDMASKKQEPESHAQDDQPMPLSDKITEAVDEPMDLDPSPNSTGKVRTLDPDVEMTGERTTTASNGGGGAASSSVKSSAGLQRSQTMPPKKTSPLEQDSRIDPSPPGNTTTTQSQEQQESSSRSPTAYQAHFQNLKGWSASTLPNILTDAQRRRGSQQWLPGNGATGKSK